MKNLSHLTTIRGIVFFLLVALFTSCKKDAASTYDLQSISNGSIMKPGIESSALSGLSQTKTGNLLNNWGEDIANDWLQASAQHFSADDGTYAISKKLSSKHGAIPLLLQDFRFEIPSNAIIENIVLAARRFKNGRGGIGDNFVTLVRRINTFNRAGDGVAFLNPNFFQSIETEVIYPQKGSGINGGLDGKKVYQWTPAMINDPAFGVWFASLNPTGSVVVYYDVVKITVEYTLP